MSENKKRYRLAELADQFDLKLRGDGNITVAGVGTLQSAGPDQISFLSNRSYRKQLEQTQAGAVVLHENDAEACPVACLVSTNPYVSYARIAALFDTRPLPHAGIHASAVIESSAQLGKDVHIGPHAVIGADCRIGDGCSIGPGCVIGAESRIGAGSRLHANVTVAERVTIGRRVILHSGAIIGADGFGIAFASDHWEKVPQMGSVRIGDDCEIGANTCIDRGAIEDTVLEEDVRIDNLVQVGHNVYIGAHTAIAGCSGIGGSASIGRNCLLGGNVGIIGHIEIADRVTVSARSAVIKSITEPGTAWGSMLAARPLRDWQRSVSHINKLDEMSRRIKALEKTTREKHNDE